MKVGHNGFLNFDLLIKIQLVTEQNFELWQLVMSRSKRLFNLLVISENS